MPIPEITLTVWGPDEEDDFSFGERFAALKGELRQQNSACCIGKLGKELMLMCSITKGPDTENKLPYR